MILSTSISMAVTMAVVRNLADYVLQKVKNIIALYTMFSAVYIRHLLDLILELV
jgi:cytochrome c oxidase assembly protein Cox11